MAGQKITLKKLAKKLDVSVSTVSKALNDSPEISETTKKKIKEVAKLLNYQPNNLARQLKSGKTNTIGVIIPSIQNNFFVQVLDGIEKVLKASGYNLIISTSQESLEKEEQLLDSLSYGIVDAFIVSVSEEAQTLGSFSHLERVIGLKPLVMFDRTVASITTDKVHVDDFDAVYNAVKMMQKERKNIALVSTIGNLNVGQNRKNGFLRAYKEQSGKNATPLILEVKTTELDNAVATFFKDHTFDAVVTLDAESSLAVFTEAKRRKIAIPQDLAIIGYLNEKMAEHLSPKFTTINQHGFQIGETSAKLLLKRLQNKEHIPENITITSTIQKRETYN